MASADDIEAGVPLRSLEPPSNRHPEAQPLANPTTEQRPRHDGLYSQILDSRSRDEPDSTGEDEFYTKYDIDRVVVRGLPSIAAFHTKYANTRTCRAFHYPTQWLTTRYQSQITCLLGAIASLDAEGATSRDAEGKGGRQPAPFDKEKFISRCLRSPDQTSLIQVPSKEDGCEEDEEQKRDRIDAMRENLAANLERLFDKYCNRINWQYELRKFPRASPNTHDKVFKHLQRTSGLDPDALDYMRAHDDFIYADADPLYERFHSFLIYIRTSFVKGVRFLSRGKVFPDENAAPFGRGAYSARAIRLWVRCLMVITGSTLVLVPVGILYLGALEKAVSFVIVVLSVLVFAFALIAFEPRMSHVLLGLAAYGAVLVVFLNIAN
ncbi:hypothetical protein F5Y14DRAFT_235103 [Nemania sp. NC0429]|nr:hypothetical protein F5Y14DRAFT_235103 [Nemania sp. NC0429]